VTARSDVLARIRAALADVPDGDETPIPRDYARSRVQPEGAVERFCERAADYQATVERVDADRLAATIGRALQGRARVAVPSGLPDRWTAEIDSAVTLVPDAREAPLSVADLDTVDAVLTGCVVGVAETGTIVLESGPLCGRRALTLVPDVHVCVVRTQDIVDDVPAAVARLRPERPLTWVSGPSATSDIELDRVEGVHGPRTLHILVVDAAVMGGDALADARLQHP
jgi:L-lactate dehydrogenase complex protein LldG